MDFFNRKALSKMAHRAEAAEKQAENLKKENEKLNARLRGDRICDGYCDFCTRGIKKQIYSPVGFNCETWICELDCKGKDFERK